MMPDPSPCPARKLFVCLLALSFGASSATAQQTIYVPASQPTIQAAINAAVNGDTVLVAPGIYPENIDFNGKAIMVTSSDGSASTIIDGGQNGVVVSFTHADFQSRWAREPIIRGWKYYTSVGQSD